LLVFELKLKEEESDLKTKYKRTTRFDINYYKSRYIDEISDFISRSIKSRDKSPQKMKNKISII
jgi:hypothetical protein